MEGSSPSSTKRDCLAGGEAVCVVCAVSTAAAEVEVRGESGSTTLQQPDPELGLGLPDMKISSNPRIVHYYGLHVQVTQKKNKQHYQYQDHVAYSSVAKTYYSSLCNLLFFVLAHPTSAAALTAETPHDL